MLTFERIPINENISLTEILQSDIPAYIELLSEREIYERTFDYRKTPGIGPRKEGGYSRDVEQVVTAGVWHFVPSSLGPRKVCASAHFDSDLRE